MKKSQNTEIENLRKNKKVYLDSEIEEAFLRIDKIGDEYIAVYSIDIIKMILAKSYHYNDLEVNEIFNHDFENLDNYLIKLE